MREYLKFYIDGTWVDPVRPNTLEVDNPTTEQVSGVIAIGSAADVDVAVQAARRAFASWSQSIREERLDVLQAIQAEYQKRSGDLADAVSEEMGAPPSLAAGPQVAMGAGHLMTAIDVLKNFSFEEQLGNTLVVKEPIESVEGLNSLKIRSSGALQTFLTEAGAAASYIPGSELYSALDSGIVDGAHWGAAQGAYSMGLYEVAKSHVQPALNIAGTDVIIVSQKALNKLPEDMQKIVKDALNEQFWIRTNEYQYKERITLAKAIEEQGVQVNVLPDEVQNKLVATAQAMWDEEGKRSENAKKALDMLKGYLADLGYL